MVAGGVALLIELAQCSQLARKNEAYSVAAAAHTKLGSHSDGSTEEKEGVERVEDNHQQRVSLERLLHGRRNEVK